MVRADYDTDPVVTALRAERRRQGLTLQEVAQRIGRGTYQAVWRWESGANNPTVTNLRAWAAVLGFELALLPVSRVAEEASREGA